MELHHYKDVSKRGRIERLQYIFTTAEGKKLAKAANVYLPYGYSEEKKYNVLYVIHGGGGNEDAWLDTAQTKNMLDQLNAEGKIKPTIVVFPTYYHDDPQEMHSKGLPMNWESDQIVAFQKELRDYVIPAVETRYSTYADGVSLEAMQASRWHRAISGFSMGGGTTWNAFLMNMDIIANFLPLSGDCWILEIRGGATKTVETVEAMIKKVKENGFTKDDFKVWAATGTTDIAYPALTPMIQEMKQRTEMFDFSEDMSQGNLHYVLKEDAPHAYEEVYHHLYNFLPYVF